MVRDVQALEASFVTVFLKDRGFVRNVFLSVMASFVKSLQG